MPVKQEVAQQLSGKWQIGMFEAPAKNPAQCCFGCVCAPCASYQQRKELLQYTGEPYVCCAGLCDCGPLGKPMDENCLYVEACCFPGWAISGNRFMLQTRFDRENTPCDDCIIWFTCICYVSVMIIKCCCEDMLPDGAEFCADCLVMAVDGCMHAQQDTELKLIKQQPYAGPPQMIMGMLPDNQQQLMRSGKGSGMGGPSAAVFGAGAAAGGAAAVVASSQQQRKQQQKQPMPQARQQAPAQVEMQSASQNQQLQQVLQQATPQSAIQIQCGSCRQVFQSPCSGIIVACPFCQTHNNIPAQAPVPSYGRAQQGGMYGGQQQGGMYGGNQNGQGQQNSRAGMGTMAVAGGAGLIGGMVMADMMF